MAIHSDIHAYSQSRFTTVDEKHTETPEHQADQEVLEPNCLAVWQQCQTLHHPFSNIHIKPITDERRLILSTHGI